MKTIVRCGSLFTGQEDEARKGAVLVFDGAGQLLYVGPEASAPRRAKISPPGRWRSAKSSISAPLPGWSRPTRLMRRWENARR